MGSATLFTYHCALGQVWAASLHPPLMYSLLGLLFLPLPFNFLFPVSKVSPQLRLCCKARMHCASLDEVLACKLQQFPV